MSDRPKPLAQVAGVPFLTQLLRWYRQQGVRTLVLAAGHMGEQVEAGYGAIPGVQVVIEPSPLGTAGALRLALARLGGVCGSGTVPAEVLVCNGDSFCGIAPRSLTRALGHPGALATMGIVEVPASADYGQVVALPNGKVTGFFEKQPPQAPRQWINTGVYAVSRAIFPLLPEQGSLERDVFPLLASRGELFAVRTTQPVLDIGTPERYAQAQTQLQLLLAQGDPARASVLAGPGDAASGLPGLDMVELAADVGIETLDSGLADGPTDTLTDTLSDTFDAALEAVKAVDIVSPILNAVSDVLESIS